MNSCAIDPPCKNEELSTAALTLVTDMCRNELRQPLQGVSVQSRRLRPYSEILKLELELPDRRLPVILKRIVHDPRNRLYQTLGHGAGREAEGFAWAAKTLANHKDLTVPRLYAVDAQEELLLMECIEGQELDERLSAVRYLSPRAKRLHVQHEFYQLGRWLRRFQGEVLWMQDDELLDRCHDATLQRLTDIQRTLTAKDLKRPDAVFDQIRERLEALRMQSHGTPVPVAPCHGDFGPWNVLIDGERLVVFDLFGFRRDLSLLDSLNLVSYLETLESSFTLSRHWLRRYLAAFRDGYGEEAVPESAPLYRFCLACQRTCRLHDEVSRSGRQWLSRLRQRRTIQRLLALLATA